MIKVGIIGGAGYTSGELLRILVNHPKVEITSVVSRSHAGESVIKAHPDLIGDIDQLFDEELSQNCEVVFVCSGHGKSKAVIESGVIPSNSKIIDLSSDYRLKDEANDFVYGLPEINREAIKKSNYIANPGCFATCIELCLLPLAANNLLNEAIHVSAITGSTGAGQNPSATTHYSWRNNNVSIYNAFKHRHLAEINESLQQLQKEFASPINFIPFRGAFARGIYAACYTSYSGTVDEAIELYQSFYKTHSFVTIAEHPIDVKQVVNTNKVVLHLEKENGQLLITGAIDNLVKGASGQAVQNMNLMFGLDETTGLAFKTLAF